MPRQKPPGAKKDKLTEREKIFIENYLISFSATDASDKAFPGQKFPGTWGCKALKRKSVIEGMKIARAERSKRTQITADKVIRELARIAFADMADYAIVTDDRNVSFVPTSVWKKGRSKVVKSLSQSITADGGSQQIVLHDKIKALHLCGLHLGMFTGAAADPADGKKLPPLIIDMSGDHLPDEYSE